MNKSTNLIVTNIGHIVYKYAIFLILNNLDSDVYNGNISLKINFPVN